MKTAVVTGGTRGIGNGLATEFLRSDCNVVITGRSQAAVNQACEKLHGISGSDRIAGFAAELGDFDSLQAVWNGAAARFGEVDIWVNNAGMSLERKPLHEQTADGLKHIVDTNLTGLMYANKIATSGMLSQGHGHIWNMEGFGSDGRVQIGMVPYGATKRAVNYLNKALAKEAADTCVNVGTLSPGIVVTDLLTGDYDIPSEEWDKAKKIFNILGDHVETVTPYLVKGMLESKKNGDKVAWLTNGKAMKRFMGAGFNKRDLFSNIAESAK